MAKINGHSDPDFGERLKPSKFDAPVVRGGGLAGEPPAGDDGSGGKGWGCDFLAVVLLAGVGAAAWGLVEAGLAVARAVA